VTRDPDVPGLERAPSRRDVLQRAAVGLAGGAALAAADLLRRGRPLPGGARRRVSASGAELRRALWVADRDARALVALDRHLHVLETWRVPWPLAIRRAGAVGLWVLAARHGPRSASRSLLLVSRRRRVELERDVGAATALAVDASGRALWLERAAGERWGAATRIGRAAPTGVVEILGKLGDVATLAVAGEHLVTAGSDGTLRQHALVPGLEPLADVAGGGPLDGLVAWGQHTWCLERAALVRRGPRLELLQRTELSGAERGRCRLAAVDGGGAWVIGARGRTLARVRSRAGTETPVGGARVGTAASPEAATDWRVALPLLGCRRGVRAPGGGLWLAAPGALLAVDSGGEVLPGQGGFRHLADVLAASGGSAEGSPP